MMTADIQVVEANNTVCFSHDHNALSLCRKPDTSTVEATTCARVLLAGCLTYVHSPTTRSSNLFAVIRQHQATNSINSADTMKTRSMTAIDDARRPTAAETIADSPFFRLFREIRDEIYDLVALSEEKLLYSITLKADQWPLKAHAAPQGAGYACSEFMVEYQDAVTRRVKALMGKGDGNGLRRSHFEPLSGSVVVVKTSEGQRAKGEYEPAQNIHAVRLVIPTILISPEVLRFEGQSKRPQGVVVFQFKFPENEQLGPLKDLPLSWEIHDSRDRGFAPPDRYNPLMQQVRGVSKTVDWKGCMRENMVWHNFFARYARVRRPQKSLVPVWSARDIASVSREQTLFV
jgi:hypothetical protein